MILRVFSVFPLLARLSLAYLTNFNYLGSSFGVPGNATYDYVVVGGGTAGLTLATRLAQNGSYSVAVVEAGSFYELGNGNYSVVPASATHFTGADPTDVNPVIDWAFVTTPQAGLGGRRLHYARGKCLGGSSARNYFLYQRGTRDAYATWANEVGDSSYEFDAFLPYLERSVDFTQANNSLRFPNASYTFAGANQSFSTNGGPLQVTIPNYADAFATWLLQAFPQIGVPLASDFVSGRLEGINWAMVTLDPKYMTRSSSETSFLRTAIVETGLITYLSTQAEKILFNGTRATGVLVNSSGLAYTLSANKEVILSAGTFQSPQLLMVSGVGPSSTLSQFGIDTISNLPGVGQNMWDHIFFGPSYQVNLITHSSLGNPAFAAAATEQFLANATGIMTTAGGDTVGWEKLPKPERDALPKSAIAALAKFPADWPEIEYLMLDGYAGDNENYITGAPQTPYNYGSVVAALVAPLSRGNVTIRSASTHDLPVVNPNWFTDPTDRQLGIAAFKRLRQVMDTQTMRNVTIGEEVYPGRNVSSDAQIEKAIEQIAITVYHAAGTCKMGRKNDTMAVVDNRARVFGVEGLRVVDASAFPFLPPGHPMSTICK